MFRSTISQKRRTTEASQCFLRKKSIKEVQIDEDENKRNSVTYLRKYLSNQHQSFKSKILMENTLYDAIIGAEEEDPISVKDIEETRNNVEASMKKALEQKLKEFQVQLRIENGSTKRTKSLELDDTFGDVFESKKLEDEKDDFFAEVTKCEVQRAGNIIRSKLKEFAKEI